MSEFSILQVKTTGIPEDFQLFFSLIFSSTHTVLTCLSMCVHHIDLGLHEKEKKYYTQQAHHIDMSEVIPL